MRIYNRFLINVLASSHLLPGKFRSKIYRVLGLAGKNTEIRSGCFFNSKYICVGSESFINHFTQFHSSYDERGKIEIGEKCFIGMNVNFCAISHELGSPEQRAGENIYQPIIVGNGVWIGSNSVILPGVNIGEGSIIAAGSVVTQDCEPNTLYAGNPAIKKKELDLKTSYTF